jgi:hypothetical protein
MSELTIYQCQGIITEIEKQAAETGEITEEQLQALVLAQTTSIEKIGNLCGYIKYLEHGIIACDTELARIENMKIRATNRLASIKQFLTPYIESKGKLSVGTFTLSTRKSESVEILDPEFCKQNPDYSTVKTTVTPDKAKIKEAIKAGKRFDGVSIVAKKNLQIR